MLAALKECLVILEKPYLSSQESSGRLQLTLAFFLPPHVAAVVVTRLRCRGGRRSRASGGGRRWRRGGPSTRDRAMAAPAAGSRERHGLGNRPRSGQGHGNRPRSRSGTGGQRKGRGESPATSPCPAPLPAPGCPRSPGQSWGGLSFHRCAARSRVANVTALRWPGTH